MDNRTKTARLRVAAGVGALILLGGGAVATTLLGADRHPAVVDASQTFTFSFVERGRYQWHLHDGSAARGRGLVQHRMFQLDMLDTADVELVPGLSTGDIVEVGQELATIRSPQLDGLLTEVRAEREALRSERDLLLAGGKEEEVAEARRQVEVSRSLRQSEQALLESTRRLVAEGAASAVELEMLTILDQVRAAEVGLAEAGLAVVSAPERPEAIARIDALLVGLDAMVDSLERQRSMNVVTSPIRGVVDIGTDVVPAALIPVTFRSEPSPPPEEGGSSVVLRVYDIDPMVVRVPVTAAHRGHIEEGHLVRFNAEGTPGSFRGEVVDVGESASAVAGRQVFWVSARVDNANGRLRPGMVGVASFGHSPFGSILRILGADAEG